MRARLAVILLCASCTTASAPLSRSEACDEQATTWCAVVDARTTATGCEIFYRHLCGATGEVAQDAQDACLDAIADMRPDPLTGYDVPDECHTTWEVAD